MEIVETILLFLIILSALVLAHECGHFFAARAFGVHVDEFGLGFPPRAKGWKRGATIYSLNWLPLGGFVRLKGEQGEAAGEADSFASKPVWQRIVILAAGVIMNMVLAILLLTGGFLMGMQDIVDIGEAPGEVRISYVFPDSAAQAADIRVGDIINKINGESVERPRFLQSFIARRAGEQLSLELIRGDETIKTAVVPRISEGQSTAAIGVGLQHTPPSDLSFVDALIRAVQTAIGLVLMIFRFIGSAFVEQKFDAFMGPVGIAALAGVAAKAGMTAVISLTAQLSVSLAVINILPIPALDGGRVLFALVEKVRGRSFHKNFENAIHVIGFLVLILLLLAVTVRDIGRLLPL